jgi:hypothetical protein
MEVYYLENGNVSGYNSDDGDSDSNGEDPLMLGKADFADDVPNSLVLNIDEISLGGNL